MPKATAACPLILTLSCISTAFVAGLISACDDVVTETDHRLHGGAGAPGLGRRRTRERSAESSFRCIGRRRSGSRRPRRSEFGWSFCHCELAGCDVQVRLVSRSRRSSRAIRHADRQPRCRTCHVGPRLRLLYASSSGLLSSSICPCLSAVPRHHRRRLRGCPHIGIMHVIRSTCLADSSDSRNDACCPPARIADLRTFGRAASMHGYRSEEHTSELQSL